MLELKNVTKIYHYKKNDKTILDNLNITFGDRGLVSVLGSSGCGKTTLLNLIGGLDSEFDGEILFCNKNIKEFSVGEQDGYRNDKIGFVFQNSFLISNMTVEENVLLSLKLSGKNDVDAVEKLLQDIGIFDLKDKYPHTLSGGEKQRVAVARAIINSPDIILADEPTGALDDENSIAVMDLLKELSKEKLVIVVTHNHLLAEQYSDRILHLCDGKLVTDISVDYTSNEQKEYQCKKSRLKIRDALVISVRNLFAEKISSSVILAVQSISIIVLCLVFIISGLFTNLIKETERNLLYTYPITIGENINYMDIVSGFTSPSVTDVANGNKLYIDETLIKLYKNMFVKTALTDDYIDYVNEIDHKLYSYKENIYDYDLLASLFSTIKVSGVNMTVSIAEMCQQFTRVNNVASAIVNYVNLFSVLPNNYQTLLEDCEIIGELPKEKGDLALVVGEDGYVQDYMMALLGFYDTEELGAFFNDELDQLTQEVDYERIFDKKYLFLNNDTIYVKGSSKYVTKSIFSETVKKVGEEYDDGITMRISCIIKKKDNDNASLHRGIYYTSQFETHMFEQAMQSNIVNDMKNNYSGGGVYYNPFTNESLNEYKFNEILRRVGGDNSPIKIKFFTDNVESKQKILDHINNWNVANPDNQVLYSDGFGQLINMVVDIVERCAKFGQIIAIVALALVGVMTGVIAFEKARQRKTEFGIMRCIGAKRIHIIQIMGFENCILGILAGLVGIGAACIAGAIANYFIPIYVDIGIVLAVCIINLVCAIIPSLIILKNNPIRSVRQ